MSDSVSSEIELFCSVVDVASSIADYAEKHRAMKEERAARAQTQTKPVSSSLSSLPSGWEHKKTSEGKIYYIDRNTQKIFWHRPEPNGVEIKLPPGWEQTMTDTRIVYYIDHHTKKTSWVPPSYPTISTVTGSMGSSNEPSVVDDEASSSEELFLVLATLGQQLLSLGVVEQSQLPSSHASVKKSISFIAKDLCNEFEELPEPMQYSITCAVVFCTACYPMHIYHGFGCGVLENQFWDLHPRDTQYPSERRNTKLAAMDKVLDYHKRIPNSLLLLKKVPEGVDRELPKFAPSADKVIEPLRKLIEDLVEAYESCGFPPPKDNVNNGVVVIRKWSVPFATWQGNEIYDTGNHRMLDHIKYQMDPGRFLFGWTVRNKLDLEPGEAVILTGNHICALAAWLECLDEMTFMIVPDEELDYSHLKYSPSLAKWLMETTGDPHGRKGGRPNVIVRNPRHSHINGSSSTEALEKSLSSIKLDSGGDLTSAASGDAMTNPTGTKRRPPPPPPPEIQLCLAKAKYTFSSEGPEELGFKTGEVLKIVDDKRDDGWWMAELNEVRGLIPASYVENM